MVAGSENGKYRGASTTAKLKNSLGMLCFDGLLRKILFGTLYFKLENNSDS